MTQLEALNYLLNNVGAASVTSLNSLHPQAVAALTKLTQAMEEVQRQGWWFNRTKNTSINGLTNADLLAGNLLSMRADKQYVLRGNVIWDTTTNSQVTSTIVARYATWLISWDKMPSIAQDVTKTVALIHFIRSELEDEEKAAKIEINLFKLTAQIRIEDIVSSNRGTKENFILSEIDTSTETTFLNRQDQIVLMEDTLLRVSRQLQARGWWFNTELDKTVTKTDTGAQWISCVPNNKTIKWANGFIPVQATNVLCDEAISEVTLDSTPEIFQTLVMLSTTYDILKGLGKEGQMAERLQTIAADIAKTESILLEEDILHVNCSEDERTIINMLNIKSPDFSITRRKLLGIIEKTLARMSRQLQARGWWFNTELNKTVTKTDTGVQWLSCSPHNKAIKWNNGFIPTQATDVLCDEVISEIPLINTPELFRSLVIYSTAYDILKSLSKSGDSTERLQALAGDILQKEVLLLEEDLLNINCTVEEKQILNTLNIKTPEFSITRRKLLMQIRETLIRVSTETQNQGWWFNTFTDVTADTVPDAIRVLTDTNTIVWNPDGTFTDTSTGLTVIAVTCEQVIKEIPFISLPRSIKSLIVWKSTLEMASLLRHQNPENTYAREKERSTMLMVQRMTLIANEENLKNLRINKLDSPRIARVMHRIKPFWRARN